jgi:hypothetical protein
MKKKRPVYLSSILVFIILNGLILSLRNFFERKNIDQEVLIYANLLMFLLSGFALLLHSKAIENPNPNAFVRSILTATVLKLFILAGAVFFYISIAGKERNENAILFSGILYFIYTFVEVRVASALNKAKNEKN